MTNPDRFLLGLLVGLAIGLLAIAVVAPLSDRLARRDLINAQALCRHGGGEVVLCGDGEWQCASATLEAK